MMPLPGALLAAWLLAEIADRFGRRPKCPMCGGRGWLRAAPVYTHAAHTTNALVVWDRATEVACPRCHRG